MILLQSKFQKLNTILFSFFNIRCIKFHKRRQMMKTKKKVVKKEFMCVIVILFKSVISLKSISSYFFLFEVNTDLR